MDPVRSFNAFRIAPRIKSLQKLASLDLIQRGSSGWLDARMTPLGRAVRSHSTH